MKAQRLTAGLSYGGIEENCTFGALIGEKRDEIRDILFKEFD